MTNADESYHYQIIGRAIKEIDVAEGNLSLDELAARIGLSPAHFQRVFSKFVGVSPKRYQQFLTLSHAKTLLRERFRPLPPPIPSACPVRAVCMTFSCGGRR